MRKRNLSLLLFFLLPIISVAQDRILVGGILLNHLTGKPVMAAHVMNLTDSLATITSPDGAFKIPVHLGDSVVFTSIGYFTKALIITEQQLSADYIEVRMVQRDYELGEVRVNPLGTKEQFRKKFMELQVDDGSIEIIGVKKPTKERRELPITEDKNEIKKAKYLFTNPLSFLYGNLSKNAKKQQEYHKLEAQKEKNRLNYTKFNEAVVERITGYDGVKLNEFMDYCNFSENDIYRFTEYELAVMILNKQQSFERITRSSGK
ncbi:MAG: hypothetical protein JKX84_00695 [Flavobacteriales bacterium]|nr:hypothetical protein [Flavobacteriales bacterium]